MAETVSLGGLRVEVRPLKLGQLRHVLDALEDMAGKSGAGLIEAATRLVAAGLAPTHPELTVERLLDLEVSIEQLNSAVAAVLRLAGLRRADDRAEMQGTGAPVMGEMQPVSSPAAVPGAPQGAAPVSSSVPSMAPSPPAVPTPIR